MKWLTGTKWLTGKKLRALKLRQHPPQARLALFAGGELGWIDSSPVARHLMTCSACRKQVSAFSADRQAVQNLTGELPPGLDWHQLSNEMAGNIRVGLAAGEAIAAFDRPSGFDHVRPKPSWLRWNAGWALAVASVVFTIAFWLNLPGPQAEHLLATLRGIRFDRIGNRVVAEPGIADETRPVTMVEASSASVQVWENGGSLSLLHPRSDGLTISVNAISANTQGSNTQGSNTQGSNTQGSNTQGSNTQGSAGARYIDSDTGLVTINRVYYAQQ